jgi:hypothetical protein
MPPAISLLPPEGRVEDAKKGCEVVVVWLSGEGGSILGGFFIGTASCIETDLMRGPPLKMVIEAYLL